MRVARIVGAGLMVAACGGQTATVGGGDGGRHPVTDGGSQAATDGTVAKPPQSDGGTRGSSDAPTRVGTLDADDGLTCPADSGGLGMFGAPCTTTTASTDCHATTMFTYCVFKASDGCSAKGQCYTACGSVPGGAIVVSGCACDGSETVDLPLAIPDGYAMQPLRGTPGPSSCSPDASAPSDGAAE
jgi:hypothetical protein